MVDTYPIGPRPAMLLPCDDDEHDCVFCGTALRDEIELLNDTCHRCEAEQELSVRLECFSDIDYVCNALINLLPTLAEYVPTNERKHFEALAGSLQSAIQKTRR